MIDLNRLKELEKKFTSAPWKNIWPDEYGTIFANDAVIKEEEICELRNALPDLIRELEAGRRLSEMFLLTMITNGRASKKQKEIYWEYRKARGG